MISYAEPQRAAKVCLYQPRLKERALMSMKLAAGILVSATLCNYTAEAAVIPPVLSRLRCGIRRAGAGGSSGDASRSTDYRPYCLVYCRNRLSICYPCT